MSNYEENDVTKRFAGKLVKIDDNGKLKNIYENNATNVNNSNNNGYTSKYDTFNDA
jgi:hypothetical protein